jgi:hypothetical protein
LENINLDINAHGIVMETSKVSNTLFTRFAITGLSISRYLKDLCSSVDIGVRSNIFGEIEGDDSLPVLTEPSPSRV